jgi:antirestriction protein ArdC
VFNLEQVDGFEPVTRAALSESERVATADAFVNGLDAILWFGGDRAFYDHQADLISMPSFIQFKSPRAYYATLAHELVHWAGHKTRLDRNLTGRCGSEAYAVEELVAELGASFLCAHLDLGGEPRRDHAPYIASWLKVLRSDPRAIISAASQAQAAADYLIEQAGAAGRDRPAAAAKPADIGEELAA